MSKNKGNSFERLICKQLSLWWSEGKSDDIFWRTASSGGRSTQRAKKGKATKNHDGDIGCVDASGQPFLDLFILECKIGYSKESIHDIIDAGPSSAKSKILGWIEKLEMQRKRLGKPWWLLIHRRDRREPLAFMPMRAASLLLDESSDLNLYPHGSLWLPSKPSMGMVVVYPLIPLLTNVTPQRIIELASRE